MQNKLKLAVIALCYAPAVFAQTDSLATQPTTISESAFTLTEAQLGEDEDMSQSVTIINSSSNIYANEVGSRPCASAIALSTRSSTTSTLTACL